MGLSTLSPLLAPALMLLARRFIVNDEVYLFEKDLQIKEKHVDEL